MKQQQTIASPDEGMTTLQKMVAELVDYYLANGGADVTRAEIRNLAPIVSFKNDWPQAYRWAMARVDAFEKAERDPSLVGELGGLLRRKGVFEQYQDRFFKLVRR